jgi:hypothetical protein
MRRLDSTGREYEKGSDLQGHDVIEEAGTLAQGAEAKDVGLSLSTV